jgi:hypothetical protein
MACKSAGIVRRPVKWYGRFRQACFCRYGKVKCASFAVHAFRPQAPAHEPGQFARQGQAYAGAAFSFGLGSFRLIVQVEDMR